MNAAFDIVRLNIQLYVNVCHFMFSELTTGPCQFILFEVNI